MNTCGHLCGLCDPLHGLTEIANTVSPLILCGCLNMHQGKNERTHMLHACSAVSNRPLMDSGATCYVRDGT